MAQIIKSNGETVEVAPANGTDFTLSELQSIVGGYIEILEFHDGRYLVLNEEGKLNDLPTNEKATTLAHQNTYLAAWDYIVGDVLVCDEGQIK